MIFNKEKDNYLNLENICTIIINEGSLYLGSYEFNKNNNKTKGKIYKYCLKDFKKKGEIETSGTFHLLKYNKKIISLNKTDICILNENLELINKKETKYMNIFGEIYLSINKLLITTNIGEIKIFDLNKLCLKTNKIKKITNGIIWSIFKFKNYLFIGTDNCEILIFNFKEFINSENNYILKTIITESAPTFFNLINNELYILTYNCFYKFDLINLSLIKMNIEGGWRFYQLENKYKDLFVLLNDTGCYLFNYNSLKLIKYYETKSNCYAFVQIENLFCFSSFYCNKVYLKLI